MNIDMIGAMAAPGAARTAGATDNAAGDDGGFLKRVAKGIEDLTGEPVSADAVQAWLQGDAPERFPSGEELADLLSDALPGEGGDLQAFFSANGADRIDVAAMLGAWAEASSTSVENRPGGSGASTLMGALRADGGGRAADRLLSALDAGKGDDGAAFQQALSGAREQSAASVGLDRPAAQNLRIAQPVGQPGFDTAVGERVTWMLRNEVQQARIQLNPPGLGPLEIAISTSDDKAHVGLTAHHAITRDALVADAARLRTMLADSGFANVSVDVSHRESGGRDGYESGENAGGVAAAGAVNGEEGGDGDAGPAPVRVHHGLVDHYA